MLAAMTGTRASSSYLTIKYHNASTNTVVGIKFAVTYYNSVKEPVATQELATPAKALKPGKSFQLVTADDSITGGGRMAINGRVVKVVFADGATWVGDDSRQCIAPLALMQ